MKEYKCPKCGNTFQGEVSFCPHCGTKLSFPAPEAKKEEPLQAQEVNREDSSRFNGEFKKALIFDLISNAASFLLAIFLLFLPIFVNYYNSGTEYEFFSLFQMMLLFFRVIGASAESFTYFVFELIISVYLIAFIITLLVLVIKNITNLLHLDNYYLTRYDNLVNRVEEPRFRYRRGMDSLGFLVSTIILFVFVMVFDKMPYVGKHFYEGVNGFVAFPIIFLAVALTFAIMRTVINSKVKNTILKERYKK